MSTDQKPTNATSLDLLRSIDAKLGALIAMIKPLVPKRVASEKDLLGAYGNPEVRLMPKDWHGADYKGKRLADCPVDLLEMLAEMYDYFGDKAEAEGKTTPNGKPVAPYEYGNAARARGWAQRIRDGKHTPPAVAVDDQGALGADDSTVDW